MSEDTAHGQHFEPTSPGNGAAQEVTPLDALKAQAAKVEELSIRVGSLMYAAQDAYASFLEELGCLNIMTQAYRSQNADTTTNSATEAAS